MKTVDGCDDCVNFTTHTTAATEVRSLYHKEKERERAEHEVAKGDNVTNTPGSKTGYIFKEVSSL